MDMHAKKACYNPFAVHSERMAPRESIHARWIRVALMSKRRGRTGRMYSSVAQLRAESSHAICSRSKSIASGCLRSQEPTPFLFFSQQN